MSYSKLQTQDKKFAFRDLRNPAYQNRAMNRKVYHGWLYQENGEWKIESRGVIRLDVESDDRIHWESEEFISAVGNRSKAQKIISLKRAYEKYKYTKNKNPKCRRGVIVFTGKAGGSKSYEFLFHSSKQIEHIYTLSDTLIQNFKEAYYLDNPSLVSDDWAKLWGEKFERGERVPVFFQKDENGNIIHFGLSYLYKIPYRFSIHDLLKNYQDYCEDKPDFAETLFGFVNGGEALKGRIHFSHLELRAGSAEPFTKPVTLPLSTPRPTFYPYYLVQLPNARVYKTYDNADAILAGHKFYPHRQELITSDEMCRRNEKICTSFLPLDKNATFIGKIRYFNLKPQELGALLSALTFFGREGYWHKIGMAKPYGFGSVEISITHDKDQKSYIDAFVQYINKTFNINMMQDRRITELLRIHKPGTFNDGDLSYCSLKEYVQIKRQGSGQGRGNRRGGGYYHIPRGGRRR
jgi:CRISPR-associated protein (TIGR03986 family)